MIFKPHLCLRTKHETKNPPKYSHLINANKQKEALSEVIQFIPLLWSSVLPPQLKSLSLADCWMKDFFMAHMYTELQMIKEALQKYQNLIEAGFSKSTYIISQIAVAYHNIRGLSLNFAIRHLPFRRMSGVG